MNRILTWIFAVLIGLILLGGIILPCQENSQKIDPFYLQRLKGGERAFMEGDYEKAVEELKIALFGIQDNMQLQAQANFYLGLSHYYLGNSSEAKICLREAKNFLGMEGLRALITDESVWFYFNRVLVDLELGEDEQKQPTGMVIPPRIPGEKRAGDRGAESEIKNLEQQIKSNPQNVSLYYELYEYYKENGNTKKAKKKLEDLIRRNPTEAKALYLLGRMHYQQRDLKDAERNLKRVFVLQKSFQIEEYVLLEARAYLILNTHLMGDRQSSYRMFAEWADRFTDEKIRYLDLEEQDRAIFMGIAHAEGTQAEIERLKIEAQGVEQGKIEEPEPVQKQDTITEQETTTEQEKVADPGGSLPTQQAETEGEASGELKAGDLVPLDQVDVPPVIKSRVDPKYPRNAFNMGIEGNVTVNALISETGDVVEVVVAEGLDGGFNEATAKAVRQWKYEPAVKSGVKVKVWKRITVTFRLKQDL